MRFDRDFPTLQEITEMEKKVKFVPMGGFDITSATDPKPIVGTTSLASCAGLAIYDPDSKVGGVLHAFFTEKEAIVQYMRDASGREIPSTGRSIVINNPFPFEPFYYLSLALIRRAEEIGGSRFEFHTFNIDFGSRTMDQNKQLRVVVEKTILELEQAGKIRSVSWKHDQDFKLDTRTGLITPYYQR